MRAIALAWLLSATASAQGVLEVPEAGLKFTMPALQKVKLAPSDDPLCVRDLHGRFGDAADKRVELSVWFLPNDRFGFAEPDELVDAREQRFREQKPVTTFEFAEREELTGSYGALPYAEYAAGELARGADPAATATVLLLAFIAERGACAIEIVVEPAVADQDLQALRDSLTQGVVVDGKPRDLRWSDAEAKQRWERDVPPKARKNPLKSTDRTAHYIVLTNSASGESFAKKMEEHYAKIAATFPFPEREGRRLLPVFLLRSKEEYLAFCEAMEVDVTAAAKGHASKDCYATWYESPNDPVHLHEATRQYFRNRLGLAGGGEWLQDGLAEYVATKREERNAVAQGVVKGKALPLRDLLKLPTLHAANASRERSLEAALLIEFLRDSAETKEKFQALVAALGRTPRHSPPAVERAVKTVLGRSIDELEAAFTQYCGKR